MNAGSKNSRKYSLKFFVILELEACHPVNRFHGGRNDFQYHRDGAAPTKDSKLGRQRRRADPSDSDGVFKQSTHVHGKTAGDVRIKRSYQRVMVVVVVVVGNNCVEPLNPE